MCHQNCCCSSCKKRALSTLIVLLIFAAGLFIYRSCSVPTIPDNLNVLLITVDTLPAHALSAYGAKTQTPTFDNLAKEGVLFARAYSSAPWTKPAIATIFSGMLPQNHSVKRMDKKIPEKLPLLAEVFKENGRQTAAVVSHTILAPKHGYAKGFDFFTNVNPTNPHKAVVGQKVTDTAIRWLQKRDQSKNFFLFLHYFDPHYNYNHHPDFDLTSAYTGDLKPGIDIRELRAKRDKFNEQDIDYLRGLYSEEVRYTDFQIGRVIEFLTKENLINNTLIVFVADHGEELMERGWIGHTRTLYNELINIPLVFHLPNIISKRTFKTPVSQADIFPTILDFAKIKPKTKLDGISLIKGIVSGRNLKKDRAVFSDVDFVSSSHVKDAYKVSVIQGNYKLIHNRVRDRNDKFFNPNENESFQLFDLANDPEEKNNIKDDKPEILEHLVKLILEYENTTPQDQKNDIEITPEEVKQLQSLGYM